MPETHELRIWACLHKGNPYQHSEALNEEVEYVKRGSNRKVIIVGDLLEGIRPGDRRFEYGHHIMPISKQVHGTLDLLEVIKNKILVISRGNHETTIKGDGDILRDLVCAPLGVKYGTVSFKLIVNDMNDNLMYKLFATHPHSGTIRSSHAHPIVRDAMEKVQLVRRLAREKMSDCIVQIAAHYHKGIVVEPCQELYLVDDGSKIKQRYYSEASPTDSYIDETKRWYGSVPGWIKKYGQLGGDGYVERAGLEPLPIGCLSMTVCNRKITRMETVLR